MTAATAPDLQVLHTVRVLGYATTRQVSVRTRLDLSLVNELLLDAQAVGLVSWTQFADDGGWSVTEPGKNHGERLLAAELDLVGARDMIHAELDEFGPLNERVTGACTRWQLTELGIADPPATLSEVLRNLTSAADDLSRIEANLVARLPRFAGYHERFTSAVVQSRTDPRWISGTDRESAHTVWFQLHEDLLATLGIPR